LSSEPESPAAEARNEIELIEACYAFPGDFELAVIARNDDATLASVLAAAATAAGPPLGHEQKASGGGKYVSHRLRVRCGSAHEAQAVRARMRALPGVMTVL
jgi:putative lipoic acid-binding regulatory protein